MDLKIWLKIGNSIFGKAIIVREYSRGKKIDSEFRGFRHVSDVQPLIALILRIVSWTGEFNNARVKSF